MSEYFHWEEHYNNIKDAKDSGFEVIYADDNTLLLDLDTEEQEKWYYDNIKTFEKNFPVEKTEEWVSKSGNKHIAITLKNPTPIELRIAMQAILGSDPIRNICEIKLSQIKANPIALFKPGVKDK